MIKDPSLPLFLSSWKINFSRCSWYTRGKNSKKDSLNANLKHYIYERESLKFLKEIILPYVKTEWERLGAWNTTTCLSSKYDVFRGQTTDKFLHMLKDNNILSTKIPPNMIHVFQPPDLTINSFAKDFMKGMFSTWFSRQISLALGARQHGRWLSSFSSQTIAPKMTHWVI